MRPSCLRLTAFQGLVYGRPLMASRPCGAPLTYYRPAPAAWMKLGFKEQGVRLHPSEVLRPEGERLLKRPGTYALVLRLERAACMTLGGLGSWPIARGWYLYVGSAQGPGGLAARLAHHLRDAQRPRWHVDWLRRYAQVHEIWAGPAADAQSEHRWAWVCSLLPGAHVPVPRFGASDCRRCPAHLLAFARAPRWESFCILFRRFGNANLPGARRAVELSGSAFEADFDQPSW